jgi:hypothetical protein
MAAERKKVEIKDKIMRYLNHHEPPSSVNGIWRYEVLVIVMQWLDGIENTIWLEYQLFLLEQNGQPNRATALCLIRFLIREGAQQLLNYIEED